MSKNDDYEIVYSSDGSHLNKKEKKETPVIPQETTLRVRLEKNHRGGKTVTVIYELPDNQKYFQKLAKKIKSTCGSGGTYKNNSIEIQGDHKEKVKLFLENLGFKVIFSGA